MKKTIALLAMALAACGGSEPETGSDLPRGVTDDMIVIGSHTDLSGGLAVWGVPLTNGQRMRYAEVHAAGGVQGRQRAHVDALCKHAIREQRETFEAAGSLHAETGDL